MSDPRIRKLKIQVIFSLEMCLTREMFSWPRQPGCIWFSFHSTPAGGQ